MNQRFKNHHNHDLYYCVVGQPIAHSRSPEIHNAFAQSLDINLIYERVEVAPGQFRSALDEFIKCGGRGMNVTVPLKNEAFQTVKRRRRRASLAQAANTIIVDTDGNVQADNTDGVGLIRDLRQNLNCELHNKRILLIGAGGAAQGVLSSLGDEKPVEIVVANRTLSKAQALIERAELQREAGSETNFIATDFNKLARYPFDVVINATSVGLSGGVPPIDNANVDANTFCYDMVYSASGRTSFLDWCAQREARNCHHGIGMLVEQAAESFFLWHGLRPNTKDVIEMLA